MACVLVCVCDYTQQMEMTELEEQLLQEKIDTLVKLCFKKIWSSNLWALCTFNILVIFTVIFTGLNNVIKSET